MRTLIAIMILGILGLGALFLIRGRLAGMAEQEQQDTRPLPTFELGLRCGPCGGMRMPDDSAVRTLDGLAFVACSPPCWDALEADPQRFESYAIDLPPGPVTPPGEVGSGAER